ncbi:hypothetical protein Psi02_13100 [Planotetraspora silvatica]|uniref:Uncharacterized protein n=1 Tax=Planotetraspora silvatica TaxID=234614 RepID=A0A8J3XM64_9ACTN|nr:hypothetical protein [Planotetraspora silvatica]GII44886.1 hypothetical protein Psi02_13100 [Planotetraspora silvatica]
MGFTRMLAVAGGAVAGFTLVAAGVALPAVAEPPPAPLVKADVKVKVGARPPDNGGLGIGVCVDLHALVRLKAEVGILAQPPCARSEPQPSPDPPPPRPSPSPSPTRRVSVPAPARPVPPPLPVVRQRPPTPKPPSPRPEPSTVASPYPVRTPMAAPARPHRNPLGTIMVLVIFSTVIATAAGVAFAAFR